MERILKVLIKLSAVALTLPATWQTAGNLYADTPVLRLIVQCAAVVLIEGALLLGWHLLDANDGKARPSQLWLYASLILTAYAGLNVIALVHREGFAGLVFRLTLGVLLMYSIVESGILTGLKVQSDERRDIHRTWAVRRVQRREAQATAIAELQAAGQVARLRIEEQRLLDTARVQSEFHRTKADVQPAVQPPASVSSPPPSSRPRPARPSKSGPPSRDKRLSILHSLVQSNPGLDRASLVQQYQRLASIGRSTAYADLDSLSLSLSGNGHHA